VTQTSAFLLTLAVELPVVFAGAWLAGVPRDAWRRLPWVALGANALTHPLLWIVDPLLAPTVAVAWRWGLLETAIAFVEGTAYAAAAGVGARRGLLLSVLANTLSFGVGWWIYDG